MSRQKTFGPPIINDKYGKPVSALTQGQYELIQAIDKYDVIFVNGPAGTGKTFLATCAAVAGLQENRYKHVSLTRPAVVSGEEMGFLPGTLDDKIAPFMKPLYDSIDKLKPKPKPKKDERSKPIKSVKSKKKKSSNTGWDSSPDKEQEMEDVFWAKQIEIAPLEYMRGSTMEKSFVILDEAQNATPAQFKLLLTRMGKGTKIVITGDASQSDLDRRIGSGFRHAQRLLKNVRGIGFVHLTDTDIVRHRLVRDIIKCYEKDDYKNHTYSNKNDDDWDKNGVTETGEEVGEFDSTPDEQIETYHGTLDISKLD